MGSYAGQAAPAYMGAEACRTCHAKQFASQSLSQHARALRPMAETDIPERLAEQPLRERSGVEFQYARRPGGLGVTVVKGDERAEALLTWAFGSGSQAVTPVGLHKGAYVEHRISYYRAIDHGARTIGHNGAPSRTAEAALGIRQDGETILRCFSCHATRVEQGLAAMTPGVSCERCHGPGGDHVRAPAAAKLRRTQEVALCAECHRAPVAGAAADPASVRFQLVGLSESACYKASSAALRCVSCHDPHADAARTAAPYTAVCLGCHADAGSSANCRRASKENCLPCHMRPSSPLPFLTFTDHRIRIYR